MLGHSHTSWDPQVDRESIAALAAQANNGNQWFVEPLSAAGREQQRSSEQRLHFKLWKEMIASERGERIMGAMRAGLDSIQQPYFAEGATEDWYEHFGIAYEYGHGVEIKFRPLTGICGGLTWPSQVPRRTLRVGVTKLRSARAP